MFRNTLKRLYYWLPPAVWAGFIFVLSNMSQPPTPAHFPYSDKVGHFALFAVLAFLLQRAFQGEVNCTSWAAAWGALVLTSLYGALDEFHQSFVPERSMEWADWLTDTFAGATPFLACLAKRKKGKKHGSHEQGASTTPN